MASVSSDRGGRRRILFVGPDGQRKSIQLRGVPVKLAGAVKLKVEAILSAKLAGLPLDAESPAGSATSATTWRKSWRPWG